MPRELGVTALYPVLRGQGFLHGQRSCERLADGLLAVHRRQDELSGTRSPGLEEQLHRGARLARQLTTARLPCSLIVDERLLVDVLKDDINRCQRTGHKCPTQTWPMTGSPTLSMETSTSRRLSAVAVGRDHAADICHGRARGREERRDHSEEETQEHDADHDQKDGAWVVLEPAPDGTQLARNQIVAGG